MSQGSKGGKSRHEVKLFEVAIGINVNHTLQVRATLDEMWESPALLGDLGVTKEDTSPESDTWVHWPHEAHGFLDVQPGPT